LIVGESVSDAAIRIRRAGRGEDGLVAGVLHEAEEWLRGRGLSLWTDSELRRDEIEAHVAEGRFFLALVGDEVAGTMRFDLEDPEVWPDVEPVGSAFVHRLAVRRAHAGGGVSGALLGWALERARAMGLDYLRLDCEAHRPKLKRLYEGFGFTYHSDVLVGPIRLARYEIPLTTLPSAPEPAAAHHERAESDE
jgi:ribosomal protein S18 acetylase RimI-like enzyme